ncbi:hypothetical protein VC83_04822 [Pseudogymnoascus destructans]|uniref:Uncharacterized protein n=2 Tax=Pseudogymnoascus destructans TaxID=655981 RepID=L8FRJ7_PSED2|nr:uncharacterized protein VC83_04822 [Pseudogymnoascus destructans]ELR03174.1 hypothetical protein GMDG_06000 [Pseudogymnoascus destructans 20631-21]OAF57505.1 hypothetical protein VC83_04822 [Pseudogymnoascus destructans]
MSYSSPALSYLPRPDGVVLADSPDRLAKDGLYHAVPIIIGSQEDEGTVFSFNQRNISTTLHLKDYLVDYFEQASSSDIDLLLKYYPDDQRLGSPFNTGFKNTLYNQYKRLAAILGDITFALTRRLAAELMTEANPEVPVWSYLDSSKTIVPYLGTSHGTARFLVSEKQLGDYYLNFLYNKDPNVDSRLNFWPKWAGKKRPILKIQSDSFFPRVIIHDNFRSEQYEYIRDNTETFSF